MQPIFVSEIYDIFGNGATVVVDCDERLGVLSVKRISDGQAPEGQMRARVNDTTIYYRILKPQTEG